MFQKCLVVARDGHDAERSSDCCLKLYKLEELLVAGAIPNATMVLTTLVFYTAETLLI